MISIYILLTELFDFLLQHSAWKIPHIFVSELNQLHNSSVAYFEVFPQQDEMVFQTSSESSENHKKCKKKSEGVDTAFKFLRT